MKKIISILMLVTAILACFSVSGCGNESVDYSYSRMSATKSAQTSVSSSKDVTAKEMIARTHVDLTDLNNKIVTYKDKQGTALASLKVKNYVVNMTVENAGAVKVTIGIMFEKTFDATSGENNAGFVIYPSYKPNDLASEDYVEKKEGITSYVADNLSVGEGFVYQFVFNAEYRGGKDRYFKIEIRDYVEQ